MRDYKKLRRDLEVFKSNAAAEYDFHPIEKWIVKELGATRLSTGKGAGKKKGKGSIVTFYHPAYRQVSRDGHFTVHILHKKKEQILRRNFRTYLYRFLRQLIDVMESEERSEAKGS